MFSCEICYIFNKTFFYRILPVAASAFIRSTHAQQTLVLMKMSWRRLEGAFRLRLQMTSSRRLQDVLIKTNTFALLIRLQKTSSRRLQDVLIQTNIFVLVIRLQDMFKTCSRRVQTYWRCLAKTSSRRLAKNPLKHLQYVLKTFQKPLHNVFNTSSRRLSKMSLRLFPDVLSS